MVKVLIHTDTRYPVNRKIIRRAVGDVFAKHKIVQTDAEVSVAVVGERKMKDLSGKYLTDGKKHEILTFALEDASDVRGGFVNPPDEVLRLGDVVLCWPEVLQLAAKEDVLVDDEV
ncbi:rRNA maturation RNAse YbeY, partial [Candidatus Curtissbacteria bacterium]|nr:rRNA maturation RNAse YbeY [Candidatus Curtissbacteria bacterium]